MKKIKSDKIILGEKLIDGFLYFDGGKIIGVEAKDIPCDEEYDFTGKYVSAGFIDMHTHGGMGYSFSDCSASEAVKACNMHLMHGTTSIVPTLSSAKIDLMEKAVEGLNSAKTDTSLLSNIIGVHLEGPYLSLNQCGAQKSDVITKPVKGDYMRIAERFNKFIVRWTYAPENDDCGEFCKYMTKNSILASVGHSDAKYQDMQSAMQNGCNLVTHLYSCTSTVTRNKGFRSLGVIETAFLHDEMYVEIIADGKHLPGELINMIIKIKGTDKVAVVTDSLAIAGTDIKFGNMCGVDFIVEDDVCKLKDRSAFAGSIATADKLIKVLKTECKLPVVQAVKMLTKVPSEILKINKGRLEKGYDSDIIVFNEDICVSDVFVGNKKAF